MANPRSFLIRFGQRDRMTFSDGLHEMTIRRRRDHVREQTVRQLSHALGSGTLIDPATIRLLGLNLYEMLFFNAHANEWFERVYEHSSEVSLVLEFLPSAIELMELPWEFLYVPERRWKQGGRYLATQAHVSLVRKLTRRATERQPLDDPGFLVVDCLPQPDTEYRSTSHAGQRCERAPSSDVDQLMAFLEMHARVDCLRFPTVLQLSAAVREARPDVVHIVGHGRFRAGDDAAFEFCLSPREIGLERWERGERIAQAVGEHVPQLVVLHTCKGGKADRYERYESAAVDLVKRGIPNVVALQHEITMREASRFVTGFYEALGQGRTIEFAMKEGRQALRSGNEAAFGFPVAYVQESHAFSLPIAPVYRPTSRDAIPAGNSRIADVPASVSSAASAGATTAGRRPSATEPIVSEPSAAASDAVLHRPRPAASPLGVRLGRGSSEP